MNKTLPWRGFTLIETLVSIGIIMFAIIGPLSVALNSAAYAKQTKDQITATYLAQEAIELLRFSRDTTFLRCANNAAACVAVDINGGVYEQNYEAAWRIFKTNLNGANGNTSCFVATNPSGCTYDVYSFIAHKGDAPTTYLPSNSACNVLYHDNRKQKGVTSGSITDGMYLCSVNGDGFSPTTFKRVVKITSIPAVATAYDSAYNDDLRVEVSITYTLTNGFTKTIKVVDFVRARV